MVRKQAVFFSFSNVNQGRKKVNKCKYLKINKILWTWKPLYTWWLNRNPTQITHIVGQHAIKQAFTLNKRIPIYKIYEVKVKNVKNKTVYYKETAEC
jgi:hypothetical protein